MSVQDWRLDHVQMAQSILGLIPLMENKYSTSGEICKLRTWMAKRIPSLGRVLHRQKAAHQDSVEGPAVQQDEDKTRPDSCDVNFNCLAFFAEEDEVGGMASSGHARHSDHHR